MQNKDPPNCFEVNQGYDGDVAWMQQPGGDPQELPAQMAGQFKDQSDLDGPLVADAFTGTATGYGAGGYEFLLGDTPRATSGEYTVQFQLKI